jgi:branched-chain amino acid transport system substrate-binding protein
MKAMNALRNQPTIIGNHMWTMDANRNPSYGAALLTVKGGKFVLAP